MRGERRVFFVFVYAAVRLPELIGRRAPGCGKRYAAPSFKTSAAVRIVRFGRGKDETLSKCLSHAVQGKTASKRTKTAGNFSEQSYVFIW